MKKRFLPLAFLTLFVLSGCAGRTAVKYEAPELAQGEVSAIYSAGEEQVKKAFLDHIKSVSPDVRVHSRKAEQFSFLFLAEEPAEYVDCGEFTVNVRGGAHPGTETFKAAQRRAPFRMGADANEDIKLTKTAGLAGVITVEFTPMGKDRTKVDIFADYVLETEIASSADVSPKKVYIKDSASFRTGEVGSSRGGSAVISPENIEGSWGMQCVSNTRLEKSILAGISQHLQ